MLNEHKKQARQRVLGKLIQASFATGRESIHLTSIIHHFKGAIAFPRMSALHAFINKERVTCPHSGSGGRREIYLDHTALQYMKDILNHQAIDIQTFSPVGDPIFSNTERS